MGLKNATKVFENVEYTVVAQSYIDVISIMIYKGERLSKMFECQLFPQPGGVVSNEMILPNLAPTPLVGTSQEDSAGQLFTSAIASMISRQSPDDTRKVVVGMGPLGPRNNEPSQMDRRELLFVIELVESCRVW